MAARETGFGAVEQYMHAGKLLALELLVRVFENPHHHWSALRAEVSIPPLTCTSMVYYDLDPSDLHMIQKGRFLTAAGDSRVVLVGRAACCFRS